MRATLDRVLDWDRKTENGFTSKEAHAKEWKEIRAGLEKLAAYVKDNAGVIRRTQ